MKLDEICTNSVSRMYAPSCPPEPPEKPICTRFGRCVGCPYPSHGFVCWHPDGSCMRFDKPAGEEMDTE